MPARTRNSGQSLRWRHSVIVASLLSVLAWLFPPPFSAATNSPQLPGGVAYTPAPPQAHSPVIKPPSLSGGQPTGGTAATVAPVKIAPSKSLDDVEIKPAPKEEDRFGTIKGK